MSNENGETFKELLDWYKKELKKDKKFEDKLIKESEE